MIELVLLIGVFMIALCSCLVLFDFGTTLGEAHDQGDLPLIACQWSAVEQEIYRVRPRWEHVERWGLEAVCS
jgi:hypothetical protein